MKNNADFFRRRAIVAHKTLLGKNTVEQREDEKETERNNNFSARSY